MTVIRLRDPEPKPDRWNRWVVIEHYPTADPSRFIRTRVGASRWKRRAIAIGHFYRGNRNDPDGFVTVESL